MYLFLDSTVIIAANGYGFESKNQYVDIIYRITIFFSKITDLFSSLVLSVAYLGWGLSLDPCL